MISNIFPISGPMREPLIILEGLISFLFFELAVVFFIRIKAQKRELKALQEKAYIWLFMGYSFMWIFIIRADYHIKDPILRLYILNLGFIVQIICALFFIYGMEKYKIFLRKFLFTKIFAVTTLTYIIVFFTAISFAAYVSTSFWFIFLVFFIIYLKELYLDFYIKRELARFKINLLTIIIGMLLVAIGYQLTTRLVVINLGISYRLLGDFFQLIGIIFLYVFFISIPSFSEYDWQDKIENVVVMHKSGLFLYKKSFREEAKEIDDSLISGELAVIKITLDQVSEKEAVSVIEKEGKIMIIHPSRYIIGALICDENLISLQILLKGFINKIESIYSKVFERWDGKLDVFQPIDGIAKETFY